jgi:hypothetical protein
MLTENARPLFTNLIDANWELSQHQKNNLGKPNFFQRYHELQAEYEFAKEALIEEIGETEYNRIMSMGKKMFA